MRILFAVLRAVIGLAIVAAIIGQLLTSVSYWQSKGGVDIATHVTHFFSFFTIESNALAAVVLLIGAVVLVTRSGPDPAWFNTLRAAATTYMVVTGVVYNLLLRGIELPQGATLAWSNEVLHLIGCLWLLVDWILAPGRSPIAARNIWKVLVFPIVWVIYTLVRGPLVADTVYGNDFWYPYPFLNPNISENGYASVAFYVVLIALVISVTAAGVLWVSRRKPVLRA